LATLAVNMQTATDLISQVKNYFIELRSDKGFEEILVDAKDLADTLEVEPEFQPGLAKNMFFFYLKQNIQFFLFKTCFKLG
jgi:hypothetical protein